VSEEILHDYILKHLAKQRNERESFSHMIWCIRDEGMYFPTTPAIAEKWFERLGFKLAHEQNERGAIRCYITVQ
jgi:hypothetical protein